MRGHRPRLQRRLLDRHTLREVSRLIDVAAAAICNVVREQLERDRLEDRQQKLVRRGNGDVLIGILDKFLVVLESERDENSVAGLYFLDVVEDLFITRPGVGV